MSSEQELKEAFEAGNGLEKVNQTCEKTIQQYNRMVDHFVGMKKELQVIFEDPVGLALLYSYGGTEIKEHIDRFVKDLKASGVVMEKLLDASSYARQEADKGSPL